MSLTLAGDPGMRPATSHAVAMCVQFRPKEGNGEQRDDESQHPETILRLSRPPPPRSPMVTLTE
jgi:hypothetical protein